jgi:hypothetical protein
MLASMFHELALRDRGNGCAARKSQGLGPEAYFKEVGTKPALPDCPEQLDRLLRLHLDFPWLRLFHFGQCQSENTIFH